MYLMLYVDGSKPLKRSNRDDVISEEKPIKRTKRVQITTEGSESESGDSESVRFFQIYVLICF